mgnify:CR=1 FL=1
MMKRSVFIAALAVFLAACGGGDSEPPTVNVTGEWKGTARSSSTNGAGPVSFSLNQVGSDVSGSAASPTNSCLKIGTLSGKISGNEMSGSITAGGERVDYKLTVIGNAMSGTYTAVTVVCGNDQGSFNLAR